MSQCVAHLGKSASFATKPQRSVFIGKSTCNAGFLLALLNPDRRAALLVYRLGTCSFDSTYEGMTELWGPDNMLSGATKALRYEPDINPLSGSGEPLRGCGAAGAGAQAQGQGQDQERRAGG